MQARRGGVSRLRSMLELLLKEYSYGFSTVVTPADIFCAYPDIWPFSRHQLPHYQRFARPLPKPIDPTRPRESLKIDAVFVYNDSRDWGLDATIMVDTLLAPNGLLGSTTAFNTASAESPRIYWSNQDMLWAAKYHLPRIGQGGFRDAFLGLMRGVKEVANNGNQIKESFAGKPHDLAMEYAESRLRNVREQMHSGELATIYMIGDNPFSDIMGANRRATHSKVKWQGILVKTGVFTLGHSAIATLPVEARPTTVRENVAEAVDWAIRREGWPDCHKDISQAQNLWRNENYEVSGRGYSFIRKINTDRDPKIRPMESGEPLER